MGISDKQRRDAEEEFNKRSANISEADANQAAKDGAKKVADMDANPPGVLAEMWDDIKTMVLMVKDYFSGDYRDVSWKVIASVAAAIAYFVSPLDIIPDIIPILGYMDDALVLKLCLNFMGEDLDNYRKWQKEREATENSA